MGAVFIAVVVVNFILFLSIAFYLFSTMLFNRDPAREIPQGNNIVCPADGRVTDVMEIKGSDLGGIKIKKGMAGKIYTLTKDVAKECYLVSIFMNPLNVHINRAPVGGEVEKIRHEKGRFLPVNNLSNGLMNEKNEIVIKHNKVGKIKVIQIAGFLARKIDCWAKEGQKLMKGERIGRINMGSQVTIIMPKTVKIAVGKGQFVKAGSTILAEY